MNIQRKIELPNDPKESFFLWGPRQSGKSTLLKTLYPKAVWYDLLQTDVYLRLLKDPSFLRQDLLYLESQKKQGIVVIDEVQKIPALLDEVHWLIENTPFVFVLCGSSARKLRRGHANLLGGRALRFELMGLTAGELQDQFDLVKMLNQGYLPRHYLTASAAPRLRAYIGDYLKEEIAAESLVRSLPAFSNFLNAASLSDGGLVNFATIARDCGVSAPAVKEHFQILVDTMLGHFLEAYRKRPKRRVIGTPKFYFSDGGVVNDLAKRGHLEPGSELFGKAFENWVFHELNAYRAYHAGNYDLSYWRLASGMEVDFIIGDMLTAIEAKGSGKITSDHMKGLREIKKDHPKLKKRTIVCLEKTPRLTEDGIEILPYKVFVKKLWAGEVTP